MKKIQLLSLMGLMAIVSACGNQNPNPAAYNYGYGLNGNQAGYYNNGIYNNGYYNNGFNNWYSQPMAVNSSGFFQAQIQVYQGQRVSFSWTAVIDCDRKGPITTREYKPGGILTKATYTFNGQVTTTDGSFDPPATGTAVVSADLRALSGNIHCGKHGDRPFDIVGFVVQRN